MLRGLEVALLLVLMYRCTYRQQCRWSLQVWRYDNTAVRTAVKLCTSPRTGTCTSTRQTTRAAVNPPVQQYSSGKKAKPEELFCIITERIHTYTAVYACSSIYNILRHTLLSLLYTSYIINVWSTTEKQQPTAFPSAVNMIRMFVYMISYIYTYVYLLPLPYLPVFLQPQQHGVWTKLFRMMIRTCVCVYI